jgi:hypothetical protein
MSLQIARRTKPLLTDLTLMWFFSCVHQMMFLEMGELREAFGTDVALKGPFARVCPQVDLQVGQLSESLVANVALVVHLAVLLLEWIRKRSVPATARRLWR